MITHTQRVLIQVRDRDQMRQVTDWCEQHLGFQYHLWRWEYHDPLNMIYRFLIDDQQLALMFIMRWSQWITVDSAGEKR